MRTALLVGWLLTLWSAALPAAPSCGANGWPNWQRYQSLYVSADGRVIDASTPAQITTSEGQSYALFFALVANDRAAFRKVLEWTQNNLAQGDLGRRLPAWQWGANADGDWQVLDDNPASDADLWIAYTLGEAGRLWHEPAYIALGKRVAQRILQEEVALIPGLGTTLLPAPRGFVRGRDWRLNASYAPLQVLRGLARQTGNELWSDLRTTSAKLIIASAPRGFAADWTTYRVPDGFMIDAETQGVGSYNAIRVYLWAGMLANGDSLRAKLVQLLAPMASDTAARTEPIESVNTQTLVKQGSGSPGFSAALLPLLASAKQPQALSSHRERVEREALQEPAYYSDSLALFGLGWLDERYRFDAAGQLIVSWQTCRRAR
jgi:endoglucanase